MDWPAWIQAFGSIASLTVAVAAFRVPHKIAKRAQKQFAAERKMLARSTQASMLPTLYRLRSTTSEFIAQHSNDSSLFGGALEPDSFDSDYFALVPEVASILALAGDSGFIQKDVTELSILLTRAQGDSSSLTKLQRDGYHAAWINNRDFHIEAAQSINALANKIITEIEAPQASKGSY